MFQIPSIVSDPLVRTAVLLSLICALTSLTFGCIYIVRSERWERVQNFKMSKEVRFLSLPLFQSIEHLQEARKANRRVLWNVWVLLVMPAIWLAWSMVLFVISILSFVWRTGASDDPEQRAPLARKDVLGPRIAITGVLVLWVVYLVFILRTPRSYYESGVALEGWECE